MLLGGPRNIADCKKINGMAFWREPIPENRMFKRFTIPSPQAAQKKTTFVELSFRFCS
jgi:hypothetical protein